MREILNRRREFQNGETPDVGAISEYAFTRLYIGLFSLSKPQQSDNYDCFLFFFAKFISSKECKGWTESTCI